MIRYTYFLTTDISSCKGKGKLYASKGDSVKLIAKHGAAWIVENRAGRRFTVRKSNLTLLT